MRKAAKPFPWKWVYVGGGVLVAPVAVALILRRKREYPV
jgi:hypothetical protein